MSPLLSALSFLFACYLAVQASRTRLCPLRCPTGTYCMRTNGTCDSELRVCAEDYACVYPAHQAHLYTHVREHTGSCAAVREDSPGPCVEQCRGDGDCRRGHACCYNGCGHTCARTATSRVAFRPSRGSCPWYAREISACGVQCVTDNGCPRDHRCCPTSCGTVCLQPCFHWLQQSGRSRSNYWGLPSRCRRPTFSTRPTFSIGYTV